MAWSEQLPSGRFRGCYRDAGGRKQRLPGTFGTKAEALRKAGSKENEQRQPGALDPKAGRVTWGVWFELWMEAHMVASSTEREYRSTARNHLLPYWEAMPLDQITLMRGKNWVKRLQREPREGGTKPRSPHTIRVAVQILVASMNAAVEDRRLPSNPVKGLQWPDLPDGPERFLTPSEVEAITHFMEPTNSLIVWTAVSSGLRMGELAGLHVPRLDLRRGGIEVIEQYDQHDRVMKPVPKDKEKRYVPIPVDIAKMLAERVAELPKAATCGVPHLSGKCPGGPLVFSGPRGAVLKSKDWGRGPWKQALSDARIEGRVRPHDLRHTFASWLVQQGVSFAELARVLGHSSWEVSRKYAHLADDGHDIVRDAISAARGAERGATLLITPPHGDSPDRAVEAS